jgi:ankyrin repeat protein
VEHGAPASIRDNDGRTALHEALSSDHIEVARFLVEHDTTPPPTPTPAPTPTQAQAPGNRLFYYFFILFFFVEVYFHVM